MRRRGLVILGVLVVLLGALAAGVYLGTARFDTTLAFTVRDSVSRQWVWNATFSVQDRVIRGFYQSDAGPVQYEFTGLAPGPAELSVSAPAYEPVTVPVTLKRGRNVLESPIDLVGTAIPQLSHFIIFEEYEGSDIVLEIRPVAENGRAVLNHPCLDLRIGARISTQMKDGLYVQEETEEGSVRGEVLFQGPVTWSFDPLPETTFRYSGRIPGARVQAHSAPYRVIDYLIVVPDGRRIQSAELDQLMEQAARQPALYSDERALAAFFEPYRDRLSWYVFTSWNVEAKP